MKSAEIIAIGTELLIGDTLNTNSQFIARQLVSLGISVYHHVSVGDNPDRLRQALAQALSRADMVITTGGLGPTEDDITVQTVASLLNRTVEIHGPSFERTAQFFAERNIARTEDARAQSEVVSGAVVLFNSNGMAPGSIVEQDNKAFIILPGPPEEMKHMWQQVHTYLQAKSDEVIVSKTIQMSGIGESSAETLLKDLVHNQTNPSIGTYAKSGGGVAFRLTANAPTEAEAKALIEPVRQIILTTMADYVYGEDDTTLEEAVVALLTDQNQTLAIAESVTGGMLTSRLIDVPGASAVVREGLVCYTEIAKLNRGLVTQGQLDEHTAVSASVALSMAQNIVHTTGATIGVATTGYADSPLPGTDKPGGYIALYHAGQSHVFKYQGVGNRQRIRNGFTVFLLDKLRRLLTNRL